LGEYQTKAFITKLVIMWLEAAIYMWTINWICANILFIPTQITYWQGLFVALFFAGMGYKNIHIVGIDEE